MKKGLSIKDRVTKLIERQDIFGHPVSLTYKGQQTYQSVLGGMVSLVGKLLILVYFFTQVNTVLSRGNMSINYSLKQKNLLDLNDPSNLLRITNDNFTMALRVQQI